MFKNVKAGSFPFSRNVDSLVKNGSAIVPIEHRTVLLATTSPTSYLSVNEHFLKSTGHKVAASSNKSYSTSFLIKVSSIDALNKILTHEKKEGEWGIASIREMGSLTYQLAIAAQGEDVKISTIDGLIRQLTKQNATIIQCNNEKGNNRCTFFAAFKNIKAADQLIQMGEYQSNQTKLTFKKYDPLPEVVLCGKCWLPADHAHAQCEIRCSHCGKGHHHQKCPEGFIKDRSLH